MEKTKAIVTIISVLLVLCGTLILISTISCQSAKSPPKVPIYPGSVLVEEIHAGTDVHPWYEYSYTSTASPEEIVNFYTDNKAQCGRTSGFKEGQGCSGDAERDGVYTVFVDFESHKVEALTTYSVSVLWEGCGDFD